MADYINVWDVGTSYIECVYYLDLNYLNMGYLPVQASWYLNGVFQGNSAGMRFSGLQPDTAYTIRAVYEGNSLTTVAYTEPLPNPRPKEWYWSSAWTPGSNLVVSAGSFAACSDNGNNTWNGFLWRINEFRRYKNGGNSNNYSFVGNYAESGKDMKASQYQAARSALSGIARSTEFNAIPVFTSSSGRAISKSDFNVIATALNSTYW